MNDPNASIRRFFEQREEYRDTRPVRYYKISEGLQRLSKAQFLEMLDEIPNGGEIVLSTNVTHSDDGRIKNLISTLANRFGRMAKVTAALSSSMGEKEWGFSLGDLFKGRYVDREGNVFDEKSFSVKIAGVGSSILPKIGEALRTEFQQDSVLIRDFNTSQTFFQYA